MQPWIEDELQSSDLPDKRLNVRFRLVLDRLSLKPSFKFNAACNGRAEIEAAYRFVNNPRVDDASLLAPHYQATLQRLREFPVVLIPQDSSEVDLSKPKQQVKGAGPLGSATRHGFYFHQLLALTPDGLPLGVIASWIWARDPQELARPQAEKAAQRKQKPIDEKESFRWLEGYRTCCGVQAACPDTQIICLSDSEGDIYECLAQRSEAADSTPQADWIIRACQDRALAAVKGQSAKLFETVAKGAVLHRLKIEVSARPQTGGGGRKRKAARQARTAEVTVRAARVELRGPARPGGALANVEVNCVLVREEAPPEGAEAIEWLLLTSLPIDTPEQVLVVVEHYCVRWGIEVYFRVLKSGCQVEQSQLETAEGFKAFLALQMIVAWRVLYVLMLGRECPEMSCECVLEEDEWQAVYAVVKKEKPPEQTPSLGEMVGLIARLGGWMGRKCDGPPGPKAMWQGMQRMTDLALGWRAFASVGPTISPPKRPHR
jgi:hypothetical protein